MKQARFPQGWDENRVRRVLEQYEAQSDEEAVAEDEAAYESTTHTTMEIFWSWDTIDRLKGLCEEADLMKIDIGKLAKGIGSFEDRHGHRQTLCPSKIGRHVQGER